MPNIVIIGIDGFDPFVLDSFKGDLPHLSALYDDVSEIIIESTFPPDSICAWASIYTSILTPMRSGHGECVEIVGNGRRA